MTSFNRVILAGNLTRDVELKYLGERTALAEIGLAVNERRKDKQGNYVDETTFVDVKLWGRQAEVANEYTQKGSSVLIEGRLKLDTWESNGQKRSKLYVVADRLQLLGEKAAPQSRETAERPSSSQRRETQPVSSGADDYSPF